MISTKLGTFEEFWPHYLGEHRHPLNRALHFAGTSLVYVIVAMAIFRTPRFLFLAPATASRGWATS